MFSAVFRYLMLVGMTNASYLAYNAILVLGIFDFLSFSANLAMSFSGVLINHLAQNAMPLSFLYSSYSPAIGMFSLTKSGLYLKRYFAFIMAPVLSPINIILAFVLLCISLSFFASISTIILSSSQ